MDEMSHRVPALRDTEIRQTINSFNGPECFTPDGSPLLGEAPEVIIALSLNGYQQCNYISYVYFGSNCKYDDNNCKYTIVTIYYAI